MNKLILPALCLLALPLSAQPLPEGALARLGHHRMRLYGVGSCPMVFTPDSKRIAGVGPFDSVVIQDVKTGRQVRRITGPGGWIDDIAISPDGTRLCAVSKQGRSARIWDPRTGKAVKVLEMKGMHPTAVAFSPDGSVLAIGGPGQVQIWKTATWSVARSMPTAGFVPRLVFSPDGKTLAAAQGQALNVARWRVSTGAALEPLGHVNYVYSVAYSPDGKTMVSASSDGQVAFWDAETGKRRHVARSRDRVTSLAFAPGGKYVAGASAGGTVQLWAVDPKREDVLKVLGEKGGERTLIQGARGRGRSTLVFSPDGKTLATRVYNETSIRLWDWPAGKERPGQTGHRGMVRTLVFSEDGTRLASSDGTTVRLWDATEFKQAAAIVTRDWTVSLAFEPGSRRVVIGHRSGKIQLTSGKDRPLVLKNTEQITYVVAVGEYLAAADYKGQIHFWHTKTRKMIGIRKRRGVRGQLTALSFLPGTSKAFAVYAMGYVASWDVADGLRFQALAPKPPKRGTAEGYCTATRQLLYRIDREVQLWDAQAGKEVRRLTDDYAHQGITTTARSRDGRWMAVGHPRGILCLYDTRTGRKVRTFGGHVHQVSSLAFSRDGTRLASGGRGGVVYVWKIGD